MTSPHIPENTSLNSSEGIGMSNSTEMVTRVARAICQSRSCEGTWCCQWPANRGRLECPVDRGGYDDAARAAIAALSPEDEGGESK